MADQELEQLRQKRMAELASQQGGGRGGPSGGGGYPNAQSAQQQEEMQRQQQDMKNNILAQVLTQEARARCKKLYILFNK